MKTCLWVCLVGKEISKGDFSVLLKYTWSISMKSQHMSLAVWKYIYATKILIKSCAILRISLYTTVKKKRHSILSYLITPWKKATHILKLRNIFPCFSGREGNYLENAGLHFYAKLVLIILPLIPHSHPTLANCYKQLRAKIHSVNKMTSFLLLQSIFRYGMFLAWVGFQLFL